MVGLMKYGERLQKARLHADLTQAQLAERIHHACTQVNISKLERGNASGSEFTAQFANACGVSAMWLAEEVGEMIPGGYTTTDPQLVDLLRVLEPAAPYVKENVVRNALSACELADRARANGLHDNAGETESPTVSVSKRRLAEHKPAVPHTRRKTDAA